MLIGINGKRLALETVNDLLDLNRVSIGVLDLLGVGEGDVLETVNFTEAPEHGINILTSALDLEHVAKIKLLKGMKCEVVDHFILSEGLC